MNGIAKRRPLKEFSTQKKKKNQRLIIGFKTKMLRVSLCTFTLTIGEMNECIHLKILPEYMDIYLGESTGRFKKYW